MRHFTSVGAAWLVAQGVTGRVIGLLSQIVLAWLLVPADFGYLGLAQTITAFVSVLVGFGADDVILQRHRSLRFWLAPALVISLAFGVVGMVLVLAATPLAAMAYKAPVLNGLLPILALSLPLSALTSIPTVLLRSAMNFRFISAYGTAELVGVQIATIVLAWQGFGPYSFVIPTPVFALIRAVVFWSVTRPKIRWRFAPQQLRRLAGGGSAVLGSRLLTTAVAQGDYIALGLMAPASVVGLYFFAFRLAAQPVRMLAGSLSSVLFPALTSIRGDPGRQDQAAVRVAKLLSWAVMPLCFLQAALAAPVLGLLFGAKWTAAIPLVQLLSLGLAFDAVSWVAGSLLSARGEFRRAFRYSSVFAPLFFLAIVGGARWGEAAGVAAAVMAYYLLLGPIYTYRVLHREPGDWRRIAEIYVPPALLSAAAMGAGWGLTLLPILADRLIAQIVLVCVVGGAGYIGLARLLRPRDLSMIIAEVRALTGRSASGAAR